MSAARDVLVRQVARKAKRRAANRKKSTKMLKMSITCLQKLRNVVCHIASWVQYNLLCLNLSHFLIARNKADIAPNCS